MFDFHYTLRHVGTFYLKVLLLGDVTDDYVITLQNSLLYVTRDSVKPLVLYVGMITLLNVLSKTFLGFSGREISCHL